MNTAVGLVVSLARGGYVGTEREAEIMRLFLARNADLLILAKHYGNDIYKFLALPISLAVRMILQTQSLLAADWTG